MKPSNYLPALLLLFSSCGYRFDGPSLKDGTATLTIPYVDGDINGQLTDELVRAFASSGCYRYRDSNGRLELRVSLKEKKTDPIGWRRQRKIDGELQKELIDIERRFHLIANVELVDTATEEVLFGPIMISANEDYDYVEPENIRDLSFIDSAGVRQTSIQFSLGQLDSTEGAYDDAYLPVSRKLAKKIVDRILRARY